MTNINVDLAKTLDGTETHMIAILIDSWGDKLVIDLDLNSSIHVIDHFQPCPECGNAVLECNFADGSNVCDHCRKDRIKKISDNCTAKSSTDCGACDLDDTLCPRQERGYKDLAPVILEKLYTNTLPEDIEMKNSPIDPTDQTLDIGERIAMAVTTAEQAFWAEVVKVFPEATDGAFLMSDSDDIMKTWVEHWVDLNVPKKTAETWTQSFNLHYPLMWHRTVADYPIVITPDYHINERIFYIALNCFGIRIIERQSPTNSIILDWCFGDNPTILMTNLIDIFSFTAKFNINKIFDDCMTIGKCGIV